MFEEKIKSVTDYNLKKLDELNASFTLNELEQTGLSPAIIKFIQADLEYKVYKTVILNNESQFNFNRDSVIRSTMILSKDLYSSFKVNRSNIRELISEAVYYIVNYLSLPNRTLNAFLFANTQEIDPIHLYFKLNHFYYYDHIPKTVNAFLSKKGKSSLNVSELADLLSRMDSAAVDFEKEKVISIGIKSIAEFYFQESENNSFVHCIALERYLKEKELYDEIQKLNEDLEADKKEKCRIYDVYKSLGYQLEAAEYIDLEENYSADEEESLEERGEIIFDEKLVADETLNNERLMEEKNRAEEKIEDEDKFQEENYPEEDDEVEKIIVSPDDELSKSKDTFVVDNTTKEIVFEDEIDKITEEKQNEDNGIPEDDQSNIKKGIKSEAVNDAAYNFMGNNQSGIDLFELFKNKDVSKIVTAIFNNDIDDFASAVEKLNECKNYEDANAELEKILASRKIKPKTKEAVLFREMISEFFEQR